MGSDVVLAIRWWGVLFLVGAAAFPLTKALFGCSMTGSRLVRNGWWDGGYIFAKAVGMAVVTWVVYALGTARLFPFSTTGVVIALCAVFCFGAWLVRGKKGDRGDGGDKGNRVFLVILEELFFFGALLFWSWIKGHEPSIRGLEKFMDFGFMKSILISSYFPASDMWFAGHSINYYYFGHIVTAVLTKLSGIDLVYTFNLMLATIFALTIMMSFSIGVQLWGYRGNGGNKGDKGRRIPAAAAGILTAFLVTLAGNMQTIYAFTKGYSGDNVKPFWQLWWGIREIGEIRGIGGLIVKIWEKLGEGMNTYWYANATRFIPYTIHEFPGYSFVVSDVHGHVLSIPFVLLAIGMMIHLFAKGDRGDQGNWGRMIFYGFLVGVLLMTNALDGPIYLGLLAVVLGVQSAKCKVQSWKTLGMQISIVLIVAVVTSLPFLAHFKSFVNGIAVNCPPAFLANTKIGPLIFEGVEKCQHSPIWMMAILWGFFIYCGGGMIYKYYNDHNDYNRHNRVQSLLFVFFLFALALVVFPEFFYFKDIYPAHFRSNTMFKLGYQAFILFSIVAGYTIVRFVFRIRSDVQPVIQNSKFKIQNWKRTAFIALLLPQLFLVSIYPIFSVRSYFNRLKEYQGLNGLMWLQKEYPDDWSAIRWLDSQNVKCQMSNVKCERFVLVEADGDSYTDYARFSAFTGIPTVVGWAVHEWLWRGGYDVVAQRREDVRKVYESTDLDETKNLLTRYAVRWIVVGSLERSKFKALKEWKFALLGKEAFRSGESVVYQIH